MITIAYNRHKTGTLLLSFAPVAKDLIHHGLLAVALMKEREVVGRLNYDQIKMDETCLLLAEAIALSYVGLVQSSDSDLSLVCRSGTKFWFRILFTAEVSACKSYYQFHCRNETNHWRHIIFNAASVRSIVFQRTVEAQQEKLLDTQRAHKTRKTFGYAQSNTVSIDWSQSVLFPWRHSQRCSCNYYCSSFQ